MTIPERRLLLMIADLLIHWCQEQEVVTAYTPAGPANMLGSNMGRTAHSMLLAAFYGELSMCYPAWCCQRCGEKIGYIGYVANVATVAG